MKSFLHYVAKDILATYGTDLSHIAIVFPNKRAALFLNEELALNADSPVWAPTYLTISDLFQRYSELTIGDPIELVCKLYTSYTTITGTEETLDHFYDWGRLLISDFDDIDKNMANAQQVFSNISNLHELDDVSYLSEEQRDALKRFFGNFSEDHNSRLKELFINLWDKLADIYNDFGQHLRQNGIAYEGMLYRDVIEKGLFVPQFDKYIFVGFNLLQQVELQLFDRLKKEGIADFYWDYDIDYMENLSFKHRKPMVKAGKYIALYNRNDRFGNSFHIDTECIYDNYMRSKDICFVKAKTENIQARYVADWLKENNRIADGKRTAIVMCDESLLQSVMHNLPKELKNINITTGYPLNQTPVASFVSQMLDLYTLGAREDGTLRISYVRTLLMHPYASLLSQNTSALRSELKEKRILYPRQDDLAKDARLALLFKTGDSNAEMLRRMAEVLKLISGERSNPLFQESVFKMHNILTRLSVYTERGELCIDRRTMQLLIKQLISSTSIPFHGEPAVGIQIMGVLETRNLDFDHLLILSCNDTNMPKGIRDSSFIPYSIRKAYGLTTVDNKVAIYSYYFFRLLQRAKDVTLVYNSSTEGVNCGEMSRFMLQMMVEGKHDIKHIMLTAGLTVARTDTPRIEKDEAIMQVLQGMESLSPSAINKYINCPLKFYYNYIANIKEPDEDIEEELTSRAFGNIFHHASEALYKDFAGTGRQITAELIDKLSDKINIEKTVDTMFRQEMLGKDNLHWRKIKYNGMQLISREVLIRYVNRLLEIDKALAPFCILALETKVMRTMTINTSAGEKTIEVGGYIDRLDILTDKNDGQRKIRVVDYKTGTRNISKPPQNISEIFSSDKIGGNTHADYYLQAMLYSLIVGEKEEYSFYNAPVVPALMFIQKAFEKDYSPILKLGKSEITDAATYSEEFFQQLQQIIEEIFNTDIRFSAHLRNDDTCSKCAYKSLCGKN